MTSKNPREPKNVRKLIADAQQRKVDSAVVRYVRKIVDEIANRRNGHGGGTRRGQR